MITQKDFIYYYVKSKQKTTLEEVRAYFSFEGSGAVKIDVATVDRRLRELVEDGKLKHRTIDGIIDHRSFEFVEPIKEVKFEKDGQGVMC